MLLARLLQSFKEFLGEGRLKEFINFVLVYLATLDIPVKRCVRPMWGDTCARSRLCCMSCRWSARTHRPRTVAYEQGRCPLSLRLREPGRRCALKRVVWPSASVCSAARNTCASVPVDCCEALKWPS